MKPMETMTREDIRDYMKLLDTHGQLYVDEFENEDIRDMAQLYLDEYQQSSSDSKRMSAASCLHTLYQVFVKGGY
tara:strand:- start:2186 stop:2410 length:225 start_codon:yes stop_codon:yes gene_type:complete